MRRLRLCSVVFVGCALAFASGPDQTPVHPSTIAARAQPFSTFHSVDALLTKLDRNSRQLRSQLDQASNLHKRRREAALRKLRKSADLRDAMQSSYRLVIISRRGEALYARRRQRYGRVLFRELRARAAAMSAALDRGRKASTVMGFARDEARFSAGLLAFVLQFQAISGGYGALACDPGAWTCCQPRGVKEDGRREMEGCTWICAPKMAACRGGCLGPRIPNVAATLQPHKSKLPSAAAHNGSKTSRPNVE